jgi:hypothetical protein
VGRDRVIVGEKRRYKGQNVFWNVLLKTIMVVVFRQPGRPAQYYK